MSMPPTKNPVRNISDTARWVAFHRAIESERPDALFRDPFARRLAGTRGQEIAGHFKAPEWTFAMRTWTIDRYLERELARGVDLVINLAAGLDARPYRMELPATLRWVEIDLPEMIDHKKTILDAEEPRCRLERVALDLADLPGRRVLLERLAVGAQKVLFLTEGLLIYLESAEVAGLAQELAGLPGAFAWISDMVNPLALLMLQGTLGRSLTRARAPLKFGPPAGVDFFRPFGWRAVEKISMLKAAAHTRRLPLALRLLARVPEWPRVQPWGGVVLLERE
jgi:methyltransferase (TIGR00027 family)